MTVSCVAALFPASATSARSRSAAASASSATAFASVAASEDVLEVERTFVRCRNHGTLSLTF